MSHRRLSSVLAHLRRTLGRSDAEGLPDAELLNRFVQQRDEAAFELLVWRHEHMVFGLCRRLLRDEHDAEDAFQATFLTLSRKAASIGRREALSSWLYKVAYRCALRLRQTLQRQRQGVVTGIDPASVAVEDSGLAAVEDVDLRALVDEEVQRLPDKYRAPVILCYLEGKTYQQAADALGWPLGTLSTRLQAARERLRMRLTARGIAAPAALALLTSMNPTRAAARLAAVAVQAARQTLAGESAANVVSSRTLEIATGVMQAMSASKQKWVVAFLLIGGLFGATSWVAVRVLSQAPGEQRTESADKALSAKKDGKTATWQECARLRSAVGQSNRVLFAPDGSALAAFDGEDRLRVWNTSDWKPRWEYRCRDRYGKHLKYFTSFSPDGRLLGVYGDITDEKNPKERKAEVTLLDAANEKEIVRLPSFSALTYSPDKTLFATWEKDGVTLYDARTFRKLRKFALTPPANGFSLIFSKDASLVCIQTRERCCRLWETATGKERARLEGFDPQISPDGKSVSTLLPGGSVKVWDTSNGKERFSIRKEGRTGCHASFSADGKRILVRAYMELTTDGLLADLLPNRKPRLIPPRRIQPIDVCLYDAATGKELQRLPGSSDYNVHAEWSPDGRTVAYSRLETDEIEREEVVLWDVKSGRERAVLHGPAATTNRGMPSGVRNPFFSPDGSTVYTSDPFGKNLRLWDVATGKRLLDLPAEIGSVYFSTNGKWLAAVPGLLHPNQGPRDIRVFHLSERKLPPPVILGEAAKPSPPPPPPPEAPKSEARLAFDAVRQEAQHYDQDLAPKLRDTKDAAERERLERERSTAYERFAATALNVARDFPKDPAALEALEFVLRSTAATEGEAGKLRDEALALILRDHRLSPELSNLVYWMSHLYADSAEKTLARIADDSPHRAIRGRAAWRLAEALATKAEMARLIRALPELLDDPELAHRKNRLKQLRTIDPNAVARKAEEWYVKVREKYADVTWYEGSKDTLGPSAESGLFALRHLALGKVAPDIDGEDLDGKRFHLQDYRGKVVVLIFCGHWCGPCRQMNPQKQRLVERYAGKPFALLEVNSDDDREAVKRTMRKEKLTWRCWFDGSREGAIARRWGVHSWPTIFILDGKGVIRFKELRGPMLDRVVERLVKEGDDGK